jgi:hypothetical protein
MDAVYFLVEFLNGKLYIVCLINLDFLMRLPQAAALITSGITKTLHGKIIEGWNVRFLSCMEVCKERFICRREKCDEKGEQDFGPINYLDTC